MHMEGGSLWVAHCAHNMLSRSRVADDGGMTATMEKQLTDPSLQMPTTLVRRQGRLYVVRSRCDKGGPMSPGVANSPFTVAEVRGM
ncbi:superoxide dismutase [Streptomyces sp. NPDC090021]|uniref:superoxide dismutase n=1 Tax=Streptomyces sp. NPDC090021 TaxID=3365919 RepID=UPI0037F5FA84